MIKRDWLVVGAGLYGSVFSYEKKRAGQSVHVIDRRPHIAGNIYTEKVNGIQVHRYGAHIFHTSDREVWNYVNQFAEFNQYINSPIARYGDELYNLPFNMNTFSKMWGVVTPQEAREIIERQVKEAGITQPRNLEEQAISLAGRDVYEKLVKGYTQKQWGRPCSELPAFIIRRLPLRFIYDNNYFNDRYQGIPIGGYTQIVEKLLEGIPVETGRDFADCVQRTADGFLLDGVHYDRLLFTGQIDEFYGYCYGPLEYRSVRFETEELPDTDNYQGNAVVNYTSADVPYTRIIEHKHFEFGRDSETGEPIRGTIISREYSQSWEQGMEPYYPVNDEQNAALYARYAQLAGEDSRVTFGGRLGMYRYYDMDKVIRAALDAARG